MTVLLVVLILFALIIVHELGHFVAAKLFGVKVREFGVGYPPTALRLAKIGDTEYTINWIPFGGFVRLFGDEGDPERGKGSFVDASRARQALILVSGIAMNLIAGWALFTIAYTAGIPRVADSPGPGVRLFVAGVIPGSPAESAGIHGGDEITRIADASGASPQQLTPEGVKDFVEDRGGKRLALVYERNHREIETTVTPANAVIPGAAGEAGIGVDLVLVSNEALPIGEAAQTAAAASYNAFTMVAENIWRIIAGAFAGESRLGDIVGPVGLVSVVGEASESGLAQVVAYAGLISINLAVINLVPIPALDGGRLVIVAVEAVLRRKAHKFTIHLLNTIGVAAIALLMILVTYQDIERLLG